MYVSLNVNCITKWTIHYFYWQHIKDHTVIWFKEFITMLLIKRGQYFVIMLFL
jgi:hypothetical protein